MKRFLDSLIRWGLPAAAVAAIVIVMTAMWMIQKPQSFFQAILVLLGGAGIGVAGVVVIGLICVLVCVMRSRKKERK